MTTEASAAKKGKKKGKGKTVSLNTFLQDSTTGTNFVKEPPKSAATNWADATEELDPSEISTQWPDEKADKVFDLSVLPNAPRAASAAQIDRSRLPSKPPYTVYLGNLSYECSEDDIMALFMKKKLTVLSVRLPVESNSQRLRGFGYAEFETVADLVDALSLNGETVRNRQVSVDIAGGKSADRDRGDGRRPRYDDADERTSGDWRNARDDDRDSPSRGDYGGPPREYQDARRGYNQERERDYPRRDQYDRGGPPQRSRGFGQSWGGSRDHDRSDDRRDDYRRRDEGSDYGRREDRYDRYQRERDPQRSHYDEGRGGGGGPSRYGGREYEQDRRGGGGGGWGNRRSPDYERDGGRRQDDPPGERRKLQLQPRSKPLETSEGGVGGSSIFGGAKPVDTASREKEIEERLIKQKEEETEQKKPKEKASVFGDARPVDTAARERQIEEKLQAEREELERELEKRDRYSYERERHSSERETDFKDVPTRSRGNRERIGSRDSVEGGEGGDRPSRDRPDDRADRGAWRGGGRGRRDPHFKGSRDGGEGGEGGDRPSRDRPDDRADRGAWRSGGGRGRRDDDRDRGSRGRGRGRGNNEEHRGSHEDRRGSHDEKHGSHDDRYKSRDEYEDRSSREREGRQSGQQQSAWVKGKPRSLGGENPTPKAILKRQEEDTPVFSQPSRFATLEDQERDEEYVSDHTSPVREEAEPRSSEDV